MKKIILLYFFTFLLSSCSYQVEKYDTGEIKIKKYSCLDNKYYAEYYYKNGNIMAIGYNNSNNQPIGTWKEYYADGEFMYEGFYSTIDNKYNVGHYNFYDDYKPLVLYMESDKYERIHPFTNNRICSSSILRFRVISEKLHPDLYTIMYRYDYTNEFFSPKDIMSTETGFIYEIMIEDKKNLEIFLLYPRPQDIDVNDSISKINFVIPEKFSTIYDTTSVKWSFNIE